ncbi:MAG: nif-specific transcriptional activator NifA [Desulfobulbaceae bacterium]|nr:nif-specific transcriptional activator NifA [Desulfobulbaceae bacterium]
MDPLLVPANTGEAPSPLEALKMQALSEICQLIGDAVHLDTALARILQILHDILRMDRATLVLLDQHKQRLEIRAAYGLTFEEEQRGIYGLTEGICGQIFQSGSPCIVPDINSEPLFLNRTGARTTINKEQLSFIGVPVLLAQKPVGVLTVDRLFGPEVSFKEDVSFLSVLATLIGQFLALHQAIDHKEKMLVEENRSLKAELHGRFNRHYIIGQSRSMQEVFTTIEKVAPSRATALLLGESGTGKELVARAIHEASPRKEKNFVKINCAALPENLLESELFGHEKGAFTGATAIRAGRFELADGGTIFLDEIGELPLLLQAKLLRVLQEQQFERLGGTRTLKVDVRIIAATNINLGDAVASGTFRNDLYYRLNVLPFHLPPLRERKSDIPILLNHFLCASNERNDKNVELSQEVLDFLMHYNWPGNVRELQNLIERLVILTDKSILYASDLPKEMTAPTTQELPSNGSFRKSYLDHERNTGTGGHLPAPPRDSASRSPHSLEELERAEIEAALIRNGWVQARAARELGLTLRQIGYRIKKFNLHRPDFSLTSWSER